MIIAGAILAVIGLGLTIYGIYLNNNVEAQLTALFNSGNVDPGTGWIVVGVIALVVGIALLVIGLTKTTSASSGTSKKADAEPRKEPDRPRPRKDENICPYCETILPPGASFCPGCGKNIHAEVTPVRPDRFESKEPEPAPSSTPVNPIVDKPGVWNLPTDDDL